MTTLELKGSKKQIEWAEKTRNIFVSGYSLVKEEIEGEAKRYVEKLLQEKNSSVWIYIDQQARAEKTFLTLLNAYLSKTSLDMPDENQEDYDRQDEFDEMQEELMDTVEKLYKNKYKLLVVEADLLPDGEEKNKTFRALNKL